MDKSITITLSHYILFDIENFLDNKSYNLMINILKSNHLSPNVL